MRDTTSLLAKLDYRHFMVKPPDANISTIYAGDVSSMLGVVDDESVDLVVTSPPYAERRKKAYGGIPADEYVEWFLPISAELLRVLKPAVRLVAPERGQVVLHLRKQVEHLRDRRRVGPACLHQWTETQCLSCSRWSPHSDWYAR